MFLKQQKTYYSQSAFGRLCAKVFVCLFVFSLIILPLNVSAATCSEDNDQNHAAMSHASSDTLIKHQTQHDALHIAQQNYKTQEQLLHTHEANIDDSHQNSVNTNIEDKCQDSCTQCNVSCVQTIVLLNPYNIKPSANLPSIIASYRNLVLPTHNPPPISF